VSFHFFLSLFFLSLFLVHLSSFLQLETESICTAWVDKRPSKNASQYRQMVQRSFLVKTCDSLCVRSNERGLFPWLVVHPYTLIQCCIDHSGSYGSTPDHY
jgi:hypothetical protein